MERQIGYLAVITQGNQARETIPYHRLPQDPQACEALHRQCTRIIADDFKQALVLERPI